MDSTQIILIVLSFILILFIIKYVTKFLFKLLLLFLIFIITFFSFFHFSERNIFDTMNDLYCMKNNNIENLKCMCFAQNIIEGFEYRNDGLNRRQIDELKNNTLKSIYEFHKSYKLKKIDIRNCFEENGLSGGLSEEIKNDVLKYIIYRNND